MSPTTHRSSPKQLWIMPHPQGGWQGKHAGKDKAAFIRPTKSDAVDAGRDMAKNGKDELIVTGKDRLIQYKDSHGNDPIKIPG